MTGLRALGFAVAALCAPVARAHASCSITLDGDAEVVDGVRAELRRLGDGEPPCVALWARCRRTGDQLEIDLHDELGRSSLHLFASAAGAAAFLVSWSQRPLLDLEPSTAGPPTAPGMIAVSPPPGAVMALDSQDPPWHPEISLDYLAMSGTGSQWGTLAVALMKTSRIWRYGGDVRSITRISSGTVLIEPEVAFGAQIALLPRVTATGELVVGDAKVARTGGTYYSSPSMPDYGAGGIRAGLRASVVWRMSDPLGLEVQLGYDALQGPIGWAFDEIAHVALGLRWLP